MQCSKQHILPNGVLVCDVANQLGVTHMAGPGNPNFPCQSCMGEWIGGKEPTKTSLTPTLLSFVDPVASVKSNTEVGFIGLWRRFVIAMFRWRQAGFPFAPKKVLFARAKICWACEYRVGVRCGHSQCGCTAAKLLIETESCPANRWPK